MVSLIEVFGDETIVWGTIEERLAAKKLFKTPIPEDIEDVTLIADTTPLEVTHLEGDKTKGKEGMWLSPYKKWGRFIFFSISKAEIAKRVNYIGFKSLCFIDLSLQFRFVGPAVPGSKHDMYRLSENLEFLETHITQQDGVVLDK